MLTPLVWAARNVLETRLHAYTHGTRKQDRILLTPIYHHGPGYSDATPEGPRWFLPSHVPRSNGRAFHSHIMVDYTTRNTGDLQHQHTATTSKMGSPSETRVLLLAQIQAGIGLMQADQFWTLREGHYLQAVGSRETKATQSLHPRKQLCMFLDSRNPEKIKGLIHGQPCHISPLFNHNLDPAFLGWDGLGPQTLDLGPKPNLKGLSPDELFAAVHEDAL
ncbi:phosphotransferase enzyme family protein [Penicillium sp. DV-2018c]|nr:phosphotransferase enzyme family protein [Penicillium sp. DV-2018c]